MVKFKLNKTFINLLTCVFFAPLALLFFWYTVETSLAHSYSKTIEKNVMGHVVDIGYSPEVLYVDTSALFDFLLFDEASNQRKDFSDIWLRIEHDGIVVFAGALAKPYFSEAGLLYRFSESGTYTGFIRYQDGDLVLASTDFEFVVEPKVVSWKDSKFDFYDVSGVFLLGFFLACLIFFGKIYNTEDTK